MTLILLYLVVLILVAIVLFGVGSVLFGRGERLPPLPRATTATVLPASDVTGADVEALKFSQTLRGYKAGEVDWALERLGQELDQLRGQVAALRAAYGIDDFVPDSDSGLDDSYDTEVDDDPDDVPADAAHGRGAQVATVEGRGER
ncbi:DivIVA domain-containing protein [Mycolicibacterium hodleri]|uniref:DivIVA domain-containing protein n=1 Tax=Mycolicibacterium hodleri TaxID=49897 RepID=A0A502EE81_9MYCO|nr:DivIVA domain-containing protein [Mycolicibacterium hodleri]TPG36013.1 DivIVA domain-containing protein [Mycolicibacterium hodleri]